MATKKKLLEAAAGAAGGAALNVEDVFSTYLYTGTSSAQTITNGIDLAGEGGLVWAKIRSAASTNHMLVDTERGVSKAQRTNFATADQTGTFLSSFNSNGFTLANSFDMNGSGYDIASWTFRKAPKFFDVVTYTGDGVAGRTVSHNLDSEVGCILIKSTSGAGDWAVYHRGVDSTAPEDYFLVLNGTDERVDATNRWNDTAPTSTEFTVGDSIRVNENGTTYVAYLFAHNDGDGEFGSTADQDIIKCGSYTGNGSTAGPEIDLGWEPQWVMVKRADSTGGWWMWDTMRGMTASGSGDSYLAASNSNAETSSTTFYLSVQPNGFKINNASTQVNTSGGTYIYIAIRRGPMAVPESATEVFALDGTYSASSPQYYSGWPVDFWMRRYDRTTTDYVIAMDRLRGNGQLYLNTTSTNAESSYSTIGVGQMDGANLNGTSNSMAWMWKRAPSFMDVVAYTGAGYNTNVKHNLGVIPELCIAKSRTTNGVVDDWYVWCSHSGDGNDTVGFLNSSGTSAIGFHASSPSSTDLYLHGNVAYSTYPYVMYLFASLDGVSKVGSYTGTGSTQNIDCGFSSGARFVLIKRTDNTGEWRVLDTARGIVAGNDPLLNLNSTNPEEAFDDLIDPYSAGFTLTSNPMVNTNNANYIFYAIA